MSNSISSTGKEVSSTQGRGLRRSLLFKYMNNWIPLGGEFLLFTESGTGLKENKDIPLLIIFKVWYMCCEGRARGWQEMGWGLRAGKRGFGKRAEQRDSYWHWVSSQLLLPKVPNMELEKKIWGVQGVRKKSRRVHAGEAMRAAQLSSATSPGYNDRSLDTSPHTHVPVPNQILPGCPQRRPQPQKAKQKGKWKPGMQDGLAERGMNPQGSRTSFTQHLIQKKRLKTTLEQSTEELKLMNETILIVWNPIAWLLVYKDLSLL